MSVRPYRVKEAVPRSDHERLGRLAPGARRWLSPEDAAPYLARTHRVPAERDADGLPVSNPDHDPSDPESEELLMKDAPVPGLLEPVPLDALSDADADRLITMAGDDGESLLSVAGVDRARAAQLVAVGIPSAAALADADPKILAELPGVGDSTARKLRKAAAEALPEREEEGDDEVQD